MLDDHAASDAAFAGYDFLNPFRLNVPARRGDEDVVLAAGDDQIAVRIEAADVAGGPRATRFALVHVAFHDHGPGHHDFAVVDGDLDPWKTLPDGPGAAVA